MVINETPWVQFCNNEAEIATSPNVTNAFATAGYPEAGLHPGVEVCLLDGGQLEPERVDAG